MNLRTGDVIHLLEDDCSKLVGASSGKYVVEDARDAGGWTVYVTKLRSDGTYRVGNPMVKFHQCPGYNDSLDHIKVVGSMTRIFV